MIIIMILNLQTESSSMQHAKMNQTVKRNLNNDFIIKFLTDSLTSHGVQTYDAMCRCLHIANYCRRHY